MEKQPEHSTVFASLQASIEYEEAEQSAAPPVEKQVETDFQELKNQLGDEIKPYQKRSATDYLIDSLTPIMIFLMVYIVVFFLLDVRYIFTAVHDKNLRFVAFCFIMGLVALNRIIARDGSDESVLYILGLAGAVGLYTFATTELYDMGSAAGSFLNKPYLATGFNMLIFAFIWWLTNRLMHECCIDENITAGDVGILTGTARSFQKKVLRKEPKMKEVRVKAKRPKGHVLDMNEIDAVDPLEWKRPEPKKKKRISLSTADRMAKRHPGISIFYFSVPVMMIFALGLPVLINGGPGWVVVGKFYVGLFTVTALSLLLLTSLGGLREYFRARRVNFPTGIGWFWIGLGGVMTAAVCIGAWAIPGPSMPGQFAVQEHTYDPWAGPSNFQIQGAAATAAQVLDQSDTVKWVRYGVLACIGLFLLYGALRAVGGLAAKIGQRRDRYPQFVIRFFDRLDAFLERVLRMLSLPTFNRPVRIDRSVATCGRYTSPLEGAGQDPARSELERQVEVSYEALCALAADLGVARRADQTPYEFIESFPKELKGLKSEALELTTLYVRSEYSVEAMDPGVTDRLRRFWISYNRVRNRLLK